MLQSFCCSNYLCLLCAKDLKDREVKDEANRASCPYKCTTAGSGADNASGKFKLIDVPEDAKVKRYSDSQCMSIFSNNLAAQSNNVGASAVGGNNLEAKNTFSSAGGASGFKWNVNNRALGPAFEDKENILNPSAENNGRPGGIFGVRSLVLGARHQQTLSEYGSSQPAGQDAAVKSLRPPTIPGGPAGANFGIRSVGAAGFHRHTILGQQANNSISDIEVNSQTSAPHYGVVRPVIDSRGFNLMKPQDQKMRIEEFKMKENGREASLEADLRIMDQFSENLNNTPDVRQKRQTEKVGQNRQQASSEIDSSPAIDQMFGLSYMRASGGL